MKKIHRLGLLLFAAAVILMISGCGGDSAEEDGKTTITYWQYTYPSKVEEIDKQIKKFEKENPDIKVVAQDFPYDQFQQKIFTAQKAGKGPDVMNLYYGWVPEYVDKGYIQPIRDKFMSNDDIENYYVDTVKANKIDGKYYDLPIAIRSLALFWNKDMFKEAGLDPEQPPKTWNDIIEYGKKMTKRDKNGRLQQEGFADDVGGQGFHVFEEVLLRQYGVEPFGDDNKEILWDKKPEGMEAFTFWNDIYKKHKIGDPEFLNTYSEAFIAGKAGMMIDGSFRVGDVKGGAKYDWGVTELPVLEEGGVESNYTSYWTNAIASGVKGKKLEASEKFLKFITSEDVQKEWVDKVGELPAAKAVAEDDEIINDPVYGPFAEGLKHGHATFFVNEGKERDIIINKTTEIRLKNADYEKQFKSMTEELQKVRDAYFKK